MTAIGRGDGEALVSYSLETTIDVEVGWGGRGRQLNGCIVESRYRSVCGVCPRSRWRRKNESVGSLGTKKGTDTKYS